MQISRRVDYGLRTVLYLSVQDPKKWCSRTEITKQQGVPKKFLEKIIQDLMRCGLIKSKRGGRGGYTLNRSPEQISFHDIIEAIEGPIAAPNRKIGQKISDVRGADKKGALKQAKKLLMRING
jgi:Rrf2 family protein